jgi:hypothetical protein
MMRRSCFSVAILTTCLVIALGSATPARADQIIFQPGYTQAEFNAISEEAGVALSSFQAAPAEPLGFLHFDIGVEATATKINAGASYWKNAVSGSIPDYLPIPKLHARLGLPFGIDIGAIYTTVPNVRVDLVGGELKWAFLKGSTVWPAVAVRGAYTQLLNVNELKMQTYSVDLSISKGIAMFTPYLGAGYLWIKSSEQSSSVNLQAASIQKMRGFIGVQIGIPLVNLTLEAAFLPIQSYTARLSVGF